MTAPIGQVEIPEEMLEEDEGLDAPERMDPADVLAAVQRELDSALGGTTGSGGTGIRQSNRDNLEAYFGATRGDEREGRSQVVMRTVLEQVEWALPALMEIFTASAETCRFIPGKVSNPELADAREEEAKQRTQAANYIFNQENEGFMLLLTLFKDALIQKNGVVKVWTEYSSEVEQEHYSGKTRIEVAKLAEDSELTFEEVDVWVRDPDSGKRIDIEHETAEELYAESAANGLPDQNVQIFYDIVANRVREEGRVRTTNIPLEEFIINRDCRGLRDDSCRMVGHRVPTTESKMIALGFDPDVVKNVPSSDDLYASQEAIVRSGADDGFGFVNNRDGSERGIVVNEVYIKIDVDGDGISEWWRVIAGGDYAQTMLGMDRVSHHPFASVTPIPIPHRFYGLGLGDITTDLQDVDTTLWRQFLDGAYIANNPMSIVLSQGEGEAAQPMVNLDQLVRATPGGWVEEYVPGALRQMETRDTMSTLLPALELHKAMVEKRTGVMPEAMGIDSTAISKHVYGAMVQQNAAAARITMYARIFADTGVKRIFELIDRELRQNHTQAFHVHLRGEWVETDPSRWTGDMSAQVAVGLGHGNRMEKASNIQVLIQLMAQGREAGIPWITDENLFNAFQDLASAMGFKNPEAYATDPKTLPPPEPEPDPTMAALEMQRQLDAEKLAIERVNADTKRMEAETDRMKAQQEHEEKIFEIRMKYETAPPPTPSQLDLSVPPPTRIEAPPMQPPQPPQPGNGGMPPVGGLG